MLIDKDQVMSLLCCPASGQEMSLLKDRLVVNKNGIQIEYDVVDGFPILVDFEKSILNREETLSMKSVIDRGSYTGLKKKLKEIVSPPKKSTKSNIECVLKLLFEKETKPNVLIVGGGTIGQGMEPFYDDPEIRLVSFDIYPSQSVQFVADAHCIPFHEKTFDAVIIQAVLEHVINPQRVVSEIHRILKDEAFVYAETPFMQHVHEGAYDFSRFTESGHRYLFKQFDLIRSGASAGSGTQLLWALDNFFRGLFRSKKVGKLVKLLFFWLIYCDSLVPVSYNIDSASGVYFLGKKVDKELCIKEIVNHYQGAQ